MSVEEVSEWLGRTVAEVRAAIAAGSIPALMVGVEPLVNREAVIRASMRPRESGSAPTAIGASGATVAQRVMGLPRPKGFRWVEPLAEADAFTHGWPQTGGGYSNEVYDRAWSGRVSLHGVEMDVRAGVAERYGMGRLTVWLGPTVVCEFSETVSGDWASLVRIYDDDGHKHILREGETQPPLYQSAVIEPYRAVTGRSGSGVPKGMAVVVGVDDLGSAVHQAAARWLGWKRFPLERDEAA